MSEDMIDINAECRTRDGRPVRIYATDGADGAKVHGAFWHEGSESGWVARNWLSNGKVSYGEKNALDLIRVTVADQMRDQIPWDWLRDDIVAVAADPVMSCGGSNVLWLGFTTCHVTDCSNVLNASDRWVLTTNGRRMSLANVKMPEVDPARWRETLVYRPGVETDD